MGQKVLNIKTGKLENCTVGAGCQRHAHSPIKLNSDNITSIANQIYSKETKTTMLVTTLAGTQEELEVIKSQLGGEAQNLESGESVYVEVPKEEVRFMDRDKLTYALGYAIFKDSFNNNTILTYATYGTSGDSNIYLVSKV
jgi:hypothetical protein